MPNKGFTLVELAIALMVIGLLIGGVLKGQELIENAKVTSFIRQVKAYDAAGLIFRNTYGALPGDIKRPNRIPNCTTDLCLTPGDGNGQIGTLDEEIYNFFPHLTKANMIQGPEGGEIADISGTDNHELFFATPFDLTMGVGFYAPWGTDASPAHRYQLPILQIEHVVPSYSSWPPVLPVKFMIQIDNKMDDGRPLSGDVLVYRHGDCPIDLAENEYTDDETMNNECALTIGAGF